MLTQKLLNNISFSRNLISPSMFLKFSSSASALQNYESNETLKDRKLRKWRESLGDIIEKPNYWLRLDPKYFEMFRIQLDFTPWGIKKKYQNLKIRVCRKMQEYNPLRVEILGSNLAVGHFLTFLGGKVKYKGNDKWIALNKEEKTIDLPNLYDPSYILVEIDASNITLYYEALENFRNVTNVKRAIFARSPLLDEWFVDKIASLFPNLEYLDISECPKVTERALEALYKISNLKTLVVTDYHNKSSFEFACILLEDCCPGLKVKICKPKEKQESCAEITRKFKMYFNLN